MRRSIIDIDFPSGVKHLYINGKRFTRQDFLKAKELENSKIDVKLFCKKGPVNKFAIPKKSPRKIGNPIIANGIKN